MESVFSRCTIGVGVLAALGFAALSGCTEVYQGPRVVSYTDTSFYIRHIPMLDSAATANEIAADLCTGGDRKAVLTDAYQDVPLDIRYAVYKCI